MRSRGYRMLYVRILASSSFSKFVCTLDGDALTWADPHRERPWSSIDTMSVDPPKSLDLTRGGTVDACTRDLTLSKAV